MLLSLQSSATTKLCQSYLEGPVPLCDSFSFSLLKLNPGSQQISQSLKWSNLLPFWNWPTPLVPNQRVQPSVSGCPVKLLLTVPGNWLQALILPLLDSLQCYRRAQTTMSGARKGLWVVPQMADCPKLYAAPTQSVRSSSWTYLPTFLQLSRVGPS